MQYNQTIQLRDGRACVLRHALAEDAAAVIDNFDLTHGETDYLLTYPDESRSDVAAEARFLQAKADSANEVEIIARGAAGKRRALYPVPTRWKSSPRWAM